MKKQRKLVLRLILSIGIMLIMLFSIKSQYGYYFRESEAIRNSAPFSKGLIVFEKKVNNGKVIITKSASETYVLFIKKKWKIFHRAASGTAILSPMDSEASIKRTWVANHSFSQTYDTSFAVEVSDPDIKKVIVTEDNVDRLISREVAEVKSKSNFFLEMDVEHGYAATCREMKLMVGFAFRGVDEKGNIKIVGR